jgi:hypothetical protein
MKKLAILFSMLAATLLMSALPAFSGSGPFGSFGPSDYSVMGQGVETQYNVVAVGTGPYGAFGFVWTDSGVVESHHTAIAGGTGPYGSFSSFGMEPSSESRQIANKDECLLVARNCPPDMAFVQNRIDRLNAEIAKGTDVYTPAELRVLNDKLNAAYEELNRTNSVY